MKAILVLGLLLLSQIAFTSDQEMNGIQMKPFRGFTREWNLVTARYRQDSQEIRFTYANPIAWNALLLGTYPFPEGSIFGKVAFKTADDPAFNGSIVPSRTRRYQFMVKDSKKYPDTNGWGYALFSPEGRLLEKDTKMATLSCHACHKVVPERDYVFSVRAIFSPDESGFVSQVSPGIQFMSFASKEAVGQFRSLLDRKRVSKVRIAAGDIRKDFFGGTLDEITPVLIHEALSSGQPCAFLSLDQRTFKLVIPKLSRKCAKQGESWFSIIERSAFSGRKAETRETESCVSAKS